MRIYINTKHKKGNHFFEVEKKLVILPWPSISLNFLERFVFFTTFFGPFLLSVSLVLSGSFPVAILTFFSVVFTSMFAISFKIGRLRLLAGNISSFESLNVTFFSTGSFILIQSLKLLK